jgi:uncharacterized surface anchored protein
MKNIYRLYCLVLIFTSLSLNACKKCKDCIPQDTGGKVNMLKKAWKVSKVSHTGQNTPIYQNPLPSGQSIAEDYSQYRLTFTSDTDYKLIERNGSTISGKYELASNDTKIILEKGSNTEKQVEIVELQNTSLKIRFTESSTKTGNRELQIDLIPSL